MNLINSWRKTSFAWNAQAKESRNDARFLPLYSVEGPRVRFKTDPRGARTFPARPPPPLGKIGRADLLNFPDPAPFPTLQQDGFLLIHFPRRTKLSRQNSLFSTSTREKSAPGERQNEVKVKFLSRTFVVAFLRSFFFQTPSPFVIGIYFNQVVLLFLPLHKSFYPEGNRRETFSDTRISPSPFFLFFFPLAPLPVDFPLIIVDRLVSRPSISVDSPASISLSRLS